jgi:hypothetical protein
MSEREETLKKIMACYPGLVKEIMDSDAPDDVKEAVMEGALAAEYLKKAMKK